MKAIGKRMAAIALALVIIMFPAVGVAQYGGTDYEAAGVRSAMVVKTGVVVDVVASQVNEPATTSARVAGGAFGALLCAKATRHWNSYTAQASAMTACGAMGERMASSMATVAVHVQTFIVQMDDGSAHLAVVQNDPTIRRGDRVYVTLGQGTRIIKAGS